MTRFLRFPRLLPRIAIVALAVLLSGCFNPFAPRISKQAGISTPPPVPNTPQNMIRLFEWCWRNRAIEEYEEIFTDDYRFVFATSDSAGNTYRDRPWTREDELTSARNLFVGGSSNAAAQSITLSFDNNLVPFPDSRPGKNPKWHKEISTSVALTVRTDDGGGYEVQGRAKYFVVRGDSATIPTILQPRFPPDSTRWWIERWEDETVTGGGVANRIVPLSRQTDSTVTPIQRTSWGGVKVRFR